MEPERTPHSLLLGATCLSARCTPRGARAYTSRADTSLFFKPLRKTKMKPPDSQTREAEILSNDSRPSVGDVASFPIENGTFGAAGDPLTEGKPVRYCRRRSYWLYRRCRLPRQVVLE